MLGAILAGGASSRMGSDKALVEVAGVAMARRVADALIEAGAARVVLVGATVEAASRLGLATVPDRWPGEGPLAAIATALEAGADAEVVVIAACDQPGLEGDRISALVDALLAAPAQVGAAAFVTPDGRRHPLPAAYRASCGPAIAALVEGGARRADAAFDQVGVVDVQVATTVLVDLDTPADVARWSDNHQ